MSDVILNVGDDAATQPAFTEAQVQRAADPGASNVVLPADFAAQYPTPLDTTEILAMCEEINLWRNIPELMTGLKQETYREMTSLGFNSGSSYIAFADYVCPEEFTHDGSNVTVTLKNIGAKKSLGISDIMHSQAVAAAGWNGINTLVGASPAFAGLPGAGDIGTFQRQHIADVKAKEMRLMSTLVLNQWDRLLAVGSASNNTLEFDGIETLVTAGNGAHVQSTADIAASGTFSASGFDRFLSEACAAPTKIFGHPQAIQEMLSAYFQLWGSTQAVQILDKGNGNRLTPGYNFAGEVITGIGTLGVVADANFTRTANGTGFVSNLYPLRMVHNGEPLVYRRTQIPLSFKDLAPLCTAVQFMIWSKSALIMKYRCAQSKFQATFTGRIVTTCPKIY
ncbi:MAG: hypothetical protein NUV54_03010 [Candidatus Taylorbacteria bacterium]|nr:hypothetical protein [Candidatus Taylorbacteria bacterium]